MTPANGRQGDEMAAAKKSMASATDRLVDSATQGAVEVISAIATQVRTSSRDVTGAVAEDVRQVAKAVASGLHEVKAEIQVPKFVKEHPFAVIAGGLALGAGLFLVRSLTKSLPRPAARAAAHGGLGTRLAFSALEIGLSAWLASRAERSRLGALSSVSDEVLH